MTIDRRALLGGMTGAAMLAPFLMVEQAMARAAAQGAHAANSDMRSSGERVTAERGHNQLMQELFGDNLVRHEEVAMLLYPEFTALDLVGPHYFFACMMGARVHLVTTGADLAPVASDLGLAIAPTVRLQDVPADLDVLFVPGGTEGTLGVMRDARVMDWIADRASRARYITSVCTGSMILGKAGLLAGRRATSHWATFPILPAFGAIPVDQRVVRDANILTGAGVSAGLDFAIALVELLRGRNYAEALVLQAEYSPEPPIQSGTLDKASLPTGEMMSAMFAPVAEKFRAAAGD